MGHLSCMCDGDGGCDSDTHCRSAVGCYWEVSLTGWLDSLRGLAWASEKLQVLAFIYWMTGEFDRLLSAMRCDTILDGPLIAPLHLAWRWHRRTVGNRVGQLYPIPNHDMNELIMSRRIVKIISVLLTPLCSFFQGVTKPPAISIAQPTIQEDRQTRTLQPVM